MKSDEELCRALGFAGTFNTCAIQSVTFAELREGVRGCQELEVELDRLLALASSVYGSECLADSDFLLRFVQGCAMSSFNDAAWEIASRYAV